MSTFLTKLNNALWWNGIFYLFYKGASSLQTFFIFYHLTAHDFSSYINILSWIYLLLLWLDFGFKKSVPHFVPLLQHKTNVLRQFLYTIIILRSAVLVLAAIGILAYVHYSSLSISIHPSIIVMIFLAEGMTLTARLIAEALFIQWISNTYIIMITTMHMCIQYILCLHCTHSSMILYYLFLIKSFMSIVTAVGSWYLMYNSIVSVSMKSVDDSADQHQYNLTIRAFIKHSFILWINTLLRSFSERNFLVPLFTVLFGEMQANIFKVACEGALLFQRSILKTIGVTDTALFTYAQQNMQKNYSVSYAFDALTTKIARLCFPLLGIVLVLFYGGNMRVIHYNGFLIFIIMVTMYAIEVILLSCERLLEVYRHYNYLTYGYLFYTVALLFLFLNSSLIGMFLTIIGIGFVRLVSLGMFVYFCTKLHSISLYNSLRSSFYWYFSR